LKRLSELYSVDIVLPTVEGREIWLRRITKREEIRKATQPTPPGVAGTIGADSDPEM